MNEGFAGRLGLQQRVLPDYRVPFVDMLAESCDGGLSVFAGDARTAEGIAPGTPQRAQHTQARNLHLFSGAAYLCHQFGLMAWLQQWDPDVLIVEANPRYLSTPAGVDWMHQRKRPVVGWGLGAPPISGFLSQQRRRRRSGFLSQFDALIAYSRRGAQEYADAGFATDRIFVAPNAVSPRPGPIPDRPPSFQVPNVLFVGRLQRRKHVDLLLRACAELAEPRPRLTIVGDGPERHRLESLARELHFDAEFTGALRGAALDRCFAAADLFVLPGTGGLAVQQAMAHGLPVLVARGDGTQDDLARAGNGWQITPDDYPALRGALRTALSDAHQLRRMGAESHRIVAEEANLEAMVAAFLRALGSVEIRRGSERT